MAINIPELDGIPAEQRQSVMEEAVRTVNATHGKMSNVPHMSGVPWPRRSSCRWR
jgi:hypothetical protein